MTNECDHQCSGNCRRKGCNCKCGEWHETPTEEWENQLELAIAQSAPFSLTNQWSDADFTPIKNLFHNLLSSHNAELARKIEGMKWETNHIPFATDEQIRECTCSACKHNQALDAVLALLTNKNV